MLIDRASARERSCEALPVTRQSAWPPRNASFGTNAENQAAVDVRVTGLLEIAAAGRFIVLALLLGPVDLGQVLTIPRLSWVRAHRAELRATVVPWEPRSTHYLPLADSSGMPFLPEID